MASLLDCERCDHHRDIQYQVPKAEEICWLRRKCQLSEIDSHDYEFIIDFDVFVNNFTSRFWQGLTNYYLVINSLKSSISLSIMCKGKWKFAIYSHVQRINHFCSSSVAWEKKMFDWKSSKHWRSFVKHWKFETSKAWTIKSSQHKNIEQQTFCFINLIFLSFSFPHSARKRKIKSTQILFSSPNLLRYGEKLFVLFDQPSFYLSPFLPNLISNKTESNLRFTQLSRRQKRKKHKSIIFER